MPLAELIARSDAGEASTRLIARDYRERTGDSMSLGGLVAGSPLASMPWGGRMDATPWHQQEQFGFFSGTPYAIIRLIANRLASQAIQVGRLVSGGRRAKSRLRVDSKAMLPNCYKRLYTDMEVVAQHPIYDAIECPNECMVTHNLMFVTFAGIEITGHAYWWLDKDENGRVQIWPVPSHWCEPVHTSKKLFAAWRIGPPGISRKAIVPAHQVVPFRCPDPSDPFAVLSPMQANARGVSIDAAMDIAGMAGFRNGANPGLALIVGTPPEYAGLTGAQATPIALSAPQRDEMMTWFKKRYQGFLHNDEPLILDSIFKDVKQIRTTVKELDFSGSMPFVEARLYKAWGVNPISAGQIENANRASAVVADENLTTNALMPRTEMVSQVLTRFLPGFFDESGMVVFSVPAGANDPEFQLEEDTELYDRGIKSRNELRVSRNLKRLAQGDNAYVASDLGQWIQLDTESDVGHHTDDSMFHKSNLYGWSESEENMPWHNKPRRLWSYVKTLAGNQQKLRRAHELKVRSAVAAAVAELFDDANEKAQKILDQAPKKMTAKQIAAALWDEANAAAYISERATSLLAEAARAAIDKEAARAKAAAKAAHRARKKSGEIAAAFKDNLVSSAATAVGSAIAGVVKSATTVFARLAKWVAGKVLTVAAAAVVAVSGDAHAAVKKVQEQAFTSLVVGGAAKRSADTATGEATAGARNEIVKELQRRGTVAKECWFTKRDIRVRPTHVRCEGQVKKDGYYTCAGHRCEYPRDPALPIEEISECRCESVAVYKGQSYELSA